jgi:predicted HTH transcriptional regulator
MTERQTIEWKQSWHDDYLKGICGFANALGGVIYIGKEMFVRVLEYYKTTATAGCGILSERIRPIL